MSYPRQVEGPWARHYQAPWHDDALNPRFPLPLRVAFLAYGTHHANGHAKFKQGEIAKVMGRSGDDGILEPADRRTVWRAIQVAVELGLLAEGSKALCLIVPNHRIVGGMGDQHAACTRHPKPSQAAKRASLRAAS